MSRNNHADIDPLPDEPPPPYEPLNEPSSATATSISQTASAAAASSIAPTTSHAAPASSNADVSSTSAAGSNVSHNPFLSPEEQGPTTSTEAVSPIVAPSTNPFLSSVTPQATGASTSSTVTSTAVPTTSKRPPSLPPRTYTAPQSPAPSPSPSQSQSAPTRPSLDSRHSRLSSTASVTSPPPASPSTFAPPSGPPPSSSPSASSSHSQHRPHTDSYRPTTVPTPGQPLLRKGKLLVYPRDWRGCTKCNDTGYKHGDPNNPHKSCWDKYGKTFTSAMSYSVGLNGATSHFQRPLPVLSGPAMMGGGGGRPSHGYAGGGYPGAGGGGWSGPPAGGHAYGGYNAYGPPSHAPPPSTAAAPVRPPPAPSTPTVDAETEGSRMSDVPPNYQDASNVNEDQRLPSQYIPPPMPPPGHGPPPRPAPAPHHAPPGGFAGGFPPHHAHPYPPTPHVQQPFYGGGFVRPPPPGALVVMPGDPRIGGRLCYECGGRGIIESFWLGDETCFRCGGSGRIFR